jgi:hypothetical protein
MQTYQSVLRMSTKGSGLRDEAQGWKQESGKEACIEMLKRSSPSIHVGFIASCTENCSYPTVLHALGAGFKLLAPPTKHLLMAASECEAAQYEWNWWLVKDEEFSGTLGMEPRKASHE